MIKRLDETLQRILVHAVAVALLSSALAPRGVRAESAPMSVGRLGPVMTVDARLCLLGEELGYGHPSPH